MNYLIILFIYLFIYLFILDYLSTYIVTCTVYICNIPSCTCPAPPRTSAGLISHTSTSSYTLLVRGTIIAYTVKNRSEMSKLYTYIIAYKCSMVQSFRWGSSIRISL